MSDTLAKSKAIEWLAVVLCLLAALSAGLMFGRAWVDEGVSQAVPQIDGASEAYIWVKAVFWDITLFNCFVCAWLFYREEYWWRAVLGAAGFWASGSVFLGLYIAITWLRTRSFRRVLLGKHLD